MRKISLAAIGGLILSMMLAGSAGASTDYEQWLDEMYPGDGPGAAVIVVRDGDVVFRGASGMADLELGVFFGSRPRVQTGLDHQAIYRGGHHDTRGAGQAQRQR